VKDNFWRSEESEAITEIFLLLDSRFFEAAYTYKITFSCYFILASFCIEDSVKLIKVTPADSIGLRLTLGDKHSAFCAMRPNNVNLATGLMNIEPKLVVT
jgi:hypothetical protein